MAPGGRLPAKRPAAALGGVAKRPAGNGPSAAKRPAGSPSVAKLPAEAAKASPAAAAVPSVGPAPAAEAVAEEPFLVLHFDVNKTVVMSDAQQGYSVSKVVGDILGRSTHGVVGGENNWSWNGCAPSSSPQASGSVSYMAWLRKQKLGRVEELSRLSALGQEGGDVAGISSTREGIEAALRLPNGEVGDSYRSLFRQGSFPATQPWRYVVAPFFRLVQTLAERGRRFSIVFRTFGSDIGNGLCREINAFAEGQHPLYPDAGRFDGTGGRPDLRINLEDLESHGIFYRDANGTQLVLGTLQQPPPDDDVSEVGLRHYDGQNVRIVDGHPGIARAISELTAQRGLSALRDYWPWWGKVHSEKGEAGKPLYIDLDDFSTHPIFFDDHAAREDAEDAHIVDARDTSGTPLPFSSVAGVHVIRSEPLDCLSDPDYFVKLVDVAERRRRDRWQQRPASPAAADAGLVAKV